MKINIKNIRVKSICATLFISLFLSCNSGVIEELEKQRDYILSISNLRQGFLDVFTSFGDTLGTVLGFNKDTKKSDIGEQLGKIGDAVKSVKDKLESIKSDSGYDLIKDKAESVIAKVIETLGKIVDGANKIKEATSSATDKIGNSDSDGDANSAKTKSVKGLVEGISMIYGAAKDAKGLAKEDASKEIEDSKAVGKLFNTNSTANTSGADALKGAHRAVIAASGADILAAIKAANKDGKEKTIDQAQDAYEIAIATKSDGNTHASIQTNASVIAAGLALRAMAESGKLATHSTNAKEKEVNAILIGVVGKTVNEIISIIRRTVDGCLKDVSDCIKENSTSEVKSK
ncbi:variable large family protein (plasmid) [Borrelia coriaceae]|uniref:Variable large protein n=1 Tax=Borrelia coriaceae ATCC 43381 TaxID=1408429 RepID=W5T2A6_9SPIR|nr:variable large family protein [Borrelia coriaceae]AHH11441.1 Variable major outer membrane lipoprotein [Borrelia coriaceae ATCC 43381]UPA17405.1 variable large family protein [Borrelia coriaceae]